MKRELEANSISFGHHITTLNKALDKKWRFNKNKPRNKWKKTNTRL
jgi:hypothetical protein